MKIIGTFGVVVAASIALLQPAEGRSHGGGGFHGGGFHGGGFHGGGSRSSAPHFSSSSGHYSSRSGNYYRSAPGYYSAATRSSSQAAYRNRTYSRSAAHVSSRTMSRNRASTNSRQSAANRTAAVNPRGDSRFDSRLAANRTAGARSQSLNSNQRRVLAQQSRNWSRNRDHNWHGNRCRWHNNSWVIIGPWYPWGYGWDYGYYPYASYSYYDDRYYDDGYAANEYSQSEYDNGDLDSSVRRVQAALARAGYYHGAIDGSFGPATQNAVRRYQRNHGLGVTGEIDRPVIEALGLG